MLACIFLNEFPLTAESLVRTQYADISGIECYMFYSGYHSGAGSGAGRWVPETGQLFVHTMWTQSPREAAERRQCWDAQVTPTHPVTMSTMLPKAPHNVNGLLLSSLSAISLLLFLPHYFSWSQNSYLHAFCFIDIICKCLSLFPFCFPCLPCLHISKNLYFEAWP